MIYLDYIHEVWNLWLYMNENIKAVALKDSTGKIWTLPPPARHGNLFALLKDNGITHVGIKQGFITNLDRYVDRKEGYIIALAANQIKNTSAPGDTLVSEDLW